MISSTALGTTRKRIVAVIAGLVGAAPGHAAAQSTAPPADRWETQVAAYEQRDRESPPAPGGICLLGSSNIRLWTTLADDFPGMNVVNRGVGGCRLAELAVFAPRLVAAAQPRVIVVSAGTNDVNAGATAAEVRDAFASLVKNLRRTQPDATIAFLAIAPSIKRWEQRDRQREANEAVRAFIEASGDGHLRYLDANAAFLGPDGRPDPECFVEDLLHPSAVGNTRRAAILKPSLEQMLREFAVVVDPPAIAAAPPDLTRGADVDRSLTYNLGATGMRGWIHTRAASYFDGVQGRTTTASRQILVTHVGRGTPADGVVAVGDVILGVHGEQFSADARRSLALAIQEAETEAGGGHLRLVRWRDGRMDEARLSLPVLGTYAATAPGDCAKSRRILDAASAALAREPLEEDIWGAVAGLAMLASGKEEFRPRVAELAKALARGAPAAVRADMRTWDCGYRGIFLCEYHLVTGDRKVLPAIETITLALARGQGMYGTFGHGFAEPAADGGPHGPIPPYGPVNAAGLPANLAIVLGRECGVAGPEIAAAIDRGSRFFAFYADKGSIPYGEHAPFPYHENNGKNSLAAVFFALQVDRPREAAFFARMATASYRNREYGHTGQGFSHLWCCAGPAVAGPTALAAYFREVSWQFDLARRSDGSFAYDGHDEYGPGSTDDDTYFGRSGYYGMSPTAAAVLAYATPLRTLRITGRDADESRWLAADDVTTAVAAGRFDTDRTMLPFERLVAALGDWSPVVRGWAAEELARRPEAAAAVPRLLALAEGPDPRARQGACEALGFIRAPEAVPVLVRLLVHDDRWLRVKAAAALKAMGGAARPAVPGMLDALARGAEPADGIVWADPIQLAQGELAAALFNGLLKDSIDGVDRGLLHPAIRAVSKNADGMARATLVHLLQDRLTLEDVTALGPDILAAATVPCPADTMFRNEIRLAAVKALAKYRYREALDAGVALARTQGGHGSEERTGEIMRLIEGYGAAARGILPQLEALVAFFKAEVAAGDYPEGPLNERRIADVRRAIAAIEAATDAPPLRSLTGNR